ncbi:MAG: NADH-quinone oxidoreductase subunit NuoB [Candidatus Lokiarchaeota archaeon]|nr:NADH-quinone oxidoreductase subunit NuoB [Candidatus Lokiarchaeota archaeon]
MSAVGNAFVGRLRSLVEKIVNVNPIRYLVNWSKLYSLWPVHLTTACCSVEFGAANCPRFDIGRMGVAAFFGSLRQCDLIIIEGTVTKKMAKRVKKIYSQMPSPRYVIAMGACAISGGLFYNSYNIIKGVDKILPVDVYVPGCPPRPEALAHAVLLLQDKIRKGRVNITKGE